MVRLLPFLVLSHPLSGPRRCLFSSRACLLSPWGESAAIIVAQI